MSDLCTGLPPIQDTAMDVIGATQSISEDHAASLETLRDRIAEAAGLGCILFRGIILAESGSGGEASSRCLLKVFPTLPDPGLVDEPCVKANVFFRGGQLWAEILSSSRDLLSRIQLQNTGSHLDAVVAVLRRDLSPSVFSHCQGLLLGDKLPDYNHLLPHILIGKYNGELVIRSRLCKHVVNLETEQQEELDNSVCLDCRNILKKLNSGRRQPAHQVGKQNKGLVKSELGEEAEDEENSLYFSHFNIDEGGNPSDGTCQDTAEGSKDDAGVSLPPGDIKVEVKDQSVRRRKKRSAKVKEETAEVGGVGGGKRTAPGGEKTTLGPFLPARCPCGIEFSNKKEYKEHMDLIHRPNIAVFSAPYLCPQTNCVKRFKSAHDLEVHERRHRGEKPFKCEECEKLFNTAQELKVHSLRHTGAKPFSCSECGKCFGLKSARLIHMKSVHSTAKPYLCTHCGASFKTCSSLIDHRKRVHQCVKHHQCDFCEKGFFSRKDYKQHLRVHTGEKPFQCQACGKCFGRGTHLKRHTETVHKNTPATNLGVLVAANSDDTDPLAFSLSQTPDGASMGVHSGGDSALQIDSTAMGPGCRKSSAKRDKSLKWCKSSQQAVVVATPGLATFVEKLMEEAGDGSKEGGLAVNLTPARSHLPLDLAPRSWEKGKSILVQRLEAKLPNLTIARSDEQMLPSLPTGPSHPSTDLAHPILPYPPYPTGEEMLPPPSTTLSTTPATSAPPGVQTTLQ